MTKPLVFHKVCEEMFGSVVFWTSTWRYDFKDLKEDWGISEDMATKMTWFNKLHCYIFSSALLLDDTISHLVKSWTIPWGNKKTSTSQLDIGSFPLITNFQNIRHKTMPTTTLMRKKARWSRIPDPAFPENNSYQTKNLRWKALGLAIDNMKIPCLDHQCRNQLRPCQSEVHGTWAKVVKQTTPRVVETCWAPLLPAHLSIYIQDLYIYTPTKKL